MKTELNVRQIGGAAVAALLFASFAIAQTPVLDPIVPGQVLVKLRAGATIAAVNGRHQTTTLDSVAGWQVFLVQVPAGANEEAVRSALRSDVDVVEADVNYQGAAGEVRGVARSFFFNVLPTPDGVSGQAAWDQISLAGAQQASLGAGIKVAVVDTGVDALHPALAGKVLTGVNTLSNPDTTITTDPIPQDSNGDGVPDANLMGGHGTHVAAIIAHVAPAAQIIPITALDPDGKTDLFHLTAGIYAAIDAGANVINCSLGTTYESAIVAGAVGDAATRGIPVVAAAGNLVTAAGGPDGVTPEYPASSPGAISVGAVATNGAAAGFSKRNTGITIAAPGEAIRSAVPGSQYAEWTGTSMATPMVSGTVALLLAHHPEWAGDSTRVDLVHGQLQAGADPIPNHPLDLGAGALNAQRAITTPPALEPPVNYAVGVAPAEVVIGDFNGDGFGDLASTNAGSNSATVRLSDGAGQFGNPITLPTPGIPGGIAAGDFDGDLLVDLAIASESSGQVVIFRCLGGSFAAGVPYGVGVEPQQLVAIDLDGDQDIDIAAVCKDSANVSVLRNNGNGTFVSAGSYPVGSRPETIAVGNVNNASGPDLVTSNRDSNSVSVLLNNGSGVFGTAANVPLGARPRGVALGDVNGDGRDELFVIVSTTPAKILVLTNTNGTYSVANRFEIETAAEVPNALRVADVNGDGKLDLVVIVEGGGAIGKMNLYRGTGNLAAPFLSPLGIIVGNSPSGIGLGDLDRDRDLDIAVTNSASGTVSAIRSHLSETPGDVNCDDRVDMFDIDPFVLALTLPGEFAALYATCSTRTLDTDGNGFFDNFDIDPFVALLVD